jgi:LAS superfamily LD-carboxypeptidase LdcB
VDQNGLLPGSELAPITRCVNGESGRLRKDAAAAFMAMNAESERRFGVTLRAASTRVTYRDRHWQDYFWHLYITGQGDLAARPYTSNHGLGLAIDLSTQAMRDIVDQIGERYGWAKRWSDAQSEWWHLRWREDEYEAVKKFLRWQGYTPAERRWITEYDRLLAHHENPNRQAVLRRVMTEQRKRIWRAAQPKAKGGDGHGWAVANRAARYRSLLQRSS